MNVFLYGSCVSRDTAEFRGSSWERAGYVARQSLISAMNSGMVMPRGTGLSSKFQNAMVDGDFSSSLPTLLRSVDKPLDRLVIDLVDERLGVYPYPENKYLTFSNELHQSGLMNQMKGRKAFLSFGSDQHFELWTEALDKFTELLRVLSLVDKTRVVKAPFVDFTNEGSGVPQTRNLSAGAWNDLYARYYELLQAKGFRIVEIPRESLVSTDSHKWGSAQYHYVDSAYEALASRIELE